MAVEPNTAAQGLAAISPEVWKAAIPAVAGLLGVVVGGSIQILSAMFVANSQRKHRLEDEAAERNRQAATVERDRQYARAILARHLESYARSCAEAMWANNDQEEEGATNPPTFPKWPKVSWPVLGPNEMMRARDIEVRVAIQHEWIKGNVWHGAADLQDARQYYMDGAARIGLEAWRVAEGLRAEAGVEPFKFPSEGGNFAESLEAHVAKLDEQARAYQEKIAARRAAGEDDIDILLG